jgi:hypothetical protein
MDGFQLVALMAGFASVTTWLVVRNAKSEYLEEMNAEVVCLAISWIAALLVAYLMFRGG